MTMPFVTRPDALADLLSTVIGPATMRPVEWDPAGRPLYVAFEYISPRDHFNEGEGRSRRRGANCTSADAAVKFERNGRVEMLLIEWKYTESYGSHQLSGGEGAFQKRLSRYAHLAFHTNGGPIKSDTGIEFSDFFHEPFYQFARQQIMADQMKKAGDADCVRVLHVAPAANGAFERVTAPRLGRGERKATEVWKGMLVDPSTFISIATEELFGRFNASRHIDLAGWWHYVRMRYPTLTAA